MNKNAILISLSESPQTKFGQEDFETRSFPQKVFSAIWAVESEANNGGCKQYFFKASGETANFVQEALETVAAPRTADICNRAIASAFPPGLRATAKELSFSAGDFPKEILEELELLDEEFFA
jgi:hypothetical protein